MDIYSWNIGFSAYGNKWRRRRRLFHQFFNMNAVTNFDDYQRKYSYRFISRLSQTPEEFLGHAKLCVSSRTRSLITLPDDNVRLPKCDRRAHHGHNLRFGYQVARGQIPAGCGARDGVGGECRDSRRVSCEHIPNPSVHLLTPRSARLITDLYRSQTHSRLLPGHGVQTLRKAG